MFRLIRILGTSSQLGTFKLQIQQAMFMAGGCVKPLIDNFVQIKTCSRFFFIALLRDSIYLKTGSEMITCTHGMKSCERNNNLLKCH